MALVGSSLSSRPLGRSGSIGFFLGLGRLAAGIGGARMTTTLAMQVAGVRQSVCRIRGVTGSLEYDDNSAPSAEKRDQSAVKDSKQYKVVPGLDLIVVRGAKAFATSRVYFFRGTGTVFLGTPKQIRNPSRESEYETLLMPSRTAQRALPGTSK